MNSSRHIHGVIERFGFENTFRSKILDLRADDHFNKTVLFFSLAPSSSVVKTRVVHGNAKHLVDTAGLMDCVSDVDWVWDT